jgi:hypothetical protein
MGDMEAGQSIKLSRYEVLIDNKSVFETHRGRDVHGVVFGVMVGTGTHELTAHRKAVNMGLAVIKEGGDWTTPLEDGRTLQVRTAAR